MVGKTKHGRREVNRRRQLQTAIQPGVMPTPLRVPPTPCTPLLRAEVGRPLFPPVFCPSSLC